ncbi:MAG: RpiB/LacA/LacB family sugar-phosphate isomerase [Candidatus Niyogibacteria bacterium]|nr:RpiB/LacA/LacB family sugar-phosphate isomerase [Candidatus Niyogibacteria bacterium]
MKIHLASDHAGFELKEKLKSFLAEFGYETVDHGPAAFDEGDDYPDFIRPAAAAVAKSCGTERGIVLGGSGQGEAMVANRLPGIRAVVYYGGERGLEIIKLSREHNDANILSIGARFVEGDEARAAVKLWLGTFFTGEERHLRRIKKIDRQ